MYSNRIDGSIIQVSGRNTDTVVSVLGCIMWPGGPLGSCTHSRTDSLVRDALNFSEMILDGMSASSLARSAGKIYIEDSHGPKADTIGGNTELKRISRQLFFFFIF